MILSWYLYKTSVSITASSNFSLVLDPLSDNILANLDGNSHMDELESLPQIRCRNILSKLKALYLFGNVTSNRILERYSKEELHTIHETKDYEWLPLEYSIRLSECVAAEVSEEDLFRWSLRASLYSINSSMVGPFVRARMSLFMVRIASALVNAPETWNIVHCNCGSLSAVESGPGSLRLQLEDLPLIMVRSRPYLIGVSAFVQAMGKVGGVTNVKASLEEHSETTRSAVIIARWETNQQYNDILPSATG